MRRSTSLPPVSSRLLPSTVGTGWTPLNYQRGTLASPPASDKRWEHMAETQEEYSEFTSLKRLANNSALLVNRRWLRGVELCT